MSVRAYVALGSTLGDRRLTIESALERLSSRPGIALAECSSVIETDPVGGPAQPPYLNAVCAVDTTLAPRALLDALLEVEASLGRVRDVRNGPRTIDLDLLLYGDAVIDEPGLRVPHPRLAERSFVLVPLAEIAPGVRLPTLGSTAAELVTSLRAAHPGEGAGAPRPARPRRRR